MSYQTHTPAEWAASGFLGLIPVGLIWLALALAEADPGYFDPRPALSRLADTEAAMAVRNAALDAAALLLLLTTSPKGAMA